MKNILLRDYTGGRKNGGEIGMKLINFRKDGVGRLGVLTEKGVADIWEAVGEGEAPRTMRQALDLGREQTARLLAPVLERTENYLDPEKLEYAPVVEDPEKILCIGANYRAHIRESRGSFVESASPAVFAKFRNSLVGHGGTVYRNPNSAYHDYEAEIAVVIGRRAWNLSREEALDAVFGYTLANDISARDLQKAASQWIPGKACDSFCPLGPCILTADGVPFDELRLSGYKNGELRQVGSSADMIFDIPAIVSFLSRCITLEPGDLILTGTPSGVIMGRPEGQQDWLQPGDELLVREEHIGQLRVTVADR